MDFFVQLNLLPPYSFYIEGQLYFANQVEEEVMQPDYKDENQTGNDVTLGSDDPPPMTDQSPVEGTQNAFTPLVVDEDALATKVDSGPEFYEQGGLPR